METDTKPIIIEDTKDETCDPQITGIKSYRLGKLLPKSGEHPKTKIMV